MESVKDMIKELRKLENSLSFVSGYNEMSPKHLTSQIPVLLKTLNDIARQEHKDFIEEQINDFEKIINEVNSENYEEKCSLLANCLGTTASILDKTY